MKRPSGKLFTAEEIKTQASKVDAPQQRIVVLAGRETLVRTAIESLLVSDGQWELVSIPDIGNYHSIHQTIELIKPYAVIVFRDDQTESGQWLMQDCSEIKVIEVSLEDNSVQIYNKQSIWLKEATDLLSVIKI